MPDSKPAFDKYPYTTRSVLQGQGNITISDKTQLKSYIYQVYDEALSFKKKLSFRGYFRHFCPNTFFLQHGNAP